MKFSWNYIKCVFLLSFVVLLYSFAQYRNKGRKIQNTTVNFTNGENLYITKSAVNKLLIQNLKTVKKQQKDTLNLSKLEKQLSANNMIADAEVYLTVNAILGATITQRRPIARVSAHVPYYVDANGELMPLSPYHSARVPILMNMDEKAIRDVFPLLELIENDPFLKHLVVGIKKENEGYTLDVRKYNFEILFGEIKNSKHKIKNFKAFYKKAVQQGKLKKYKTVNLQFENQVVCTKM